MVTIIACLVSASIGILGVGLKLLSTGEPKKQEEIDNPWTGKKEVVQEAEKQPRKDDLAFTTFASDNLASGAKKMAGLKLPRLSGGKLLRKVMRFLAAALILVYSIVFFFAIGSPISIMFILTDFVLFYLLWLSR